MEEISIVLGLIIIVTIYIMYNKRQNTSPCDEYVAYFDKMYYDLPRLHTANDDNINYKETMNDINSVKQQQRKVRNVGDDTNLMATRWASRMDLHNKNEVGSNEYTNIDHQVTPTYLHHQLSKSNKEVMTDSGNRKATVESFADDEWLDPSFSYNEKYYFTEDDVTPDLLEIADAEFNKPRPVVPIVNKRLPSAVHQQICKRKRARKKGRLW